VNFSVLESLPPKQQWVWLNEWLQGGDKPGRELLSYLQERAQLPGFPQVLDGQIYELLWRSEFSDLRQATRELFPQGIVSLLSEQKQDYTPLLMHILSERWQDADQWTRQQLCQLAGAEVRGWLYFTEVQRIPLLDLQTIDALWRVHSLGRFGFRVQRRIWLGCGRNWEKFWRAIGWYADGTWPRYPQGFTWDVSAPAGHLPLSDQKRGVRALEALLQHPAWDEGG
jgi:hypothetical protein